MRNFSRNIRRNSFDTKTKLGVGESYKTKRSFKRSKYSSPLKLSNRLNVNTTNIEDTNKSNNSFNNKRRFKSKLSSLNKGINNNYVKPKLGHSNANNSLNINSNSVDRLLNNRAILGNNSKSSLTKIKFKGSGKNINNNLQNGYDRDNIAGGYGKSIGTRNSYWQGNNAVTQGGMYNNAYHGDTFSQPHNSTVTRNKNTGGFQGNYSGSNRANHFVGTGGSYGKNFGTRNSYWQGNNAVTQGGMYNNAYHGDTFSQPHNSTATKNKYTGGYSGINKTYNKWKV